jgi:hypothetical protein
MDKQDTLNNLRKQYHNLAKLYFAELQKGAPIEPLNYLKNRMDVLIGEINELEKELNISNDPADN